MSYKLKFLPTALKEWKKLENIIQVQFKKKLEERLAHITKPISLSVIGCVVNGPGEALFTDVGFTGGGKGSGMIYLNGKTIAKAENEEMIDRIVEMVEKRAEEMK